MSMQISHDDLAVLYSLLYRQEGELLRLQSIVDQHEHFQAKAAERERILRERVTHLEALVPEGTL